MNIGTKVRIKDCRQSEYKGLLGTIEGLAPALGNTTIYKVRVSEVLVIPGWFEEGDLETLEA